MISGNPRARSFDNKTLTAPVGGRPVAERVTFACLTAKPQKETNGMEQTDCINGLRAQVHFQSCWDGLNLYKSDQSHVAYMSGIDNGKCPSTHPVPLPHLFFEVYYFPNKIRQDGGEFVWSMGDTTGYGFHGDFLNGWNSTTLKNAIDAKCLTTGSSGLIDDCPIFKPYHWNTASWNCPQRHPMIDEPMNGMIDELPGCIKITRGPENAASSDMSCSPDHDAKISKLTGRIGPNNMGVNFTQPLMTIDALVGEAFGNDGWTY